MKQRTANYGDEAGRGMLRGGSPAFVWRNREFALASAVAENRHSCRLRHVTPPNTFSTR